MTPPAGGSDPKNPHDALFRSTFSNVEHAAAELRSVLPTELLAGLNLTSLSVVSGSYVDAHLRSSQSDLLFCLEVFGKPGFLYLLFEHQSRVDELMPFRILKYVVRILDRHVAATGAGARALPLPFVLPLVLHHSLAGWTAATRVEDLFDPELVAEPNLRGHVPRLSFLLDDISHISDEELRARALGLLPTLTLWALRDARHPGRVQASLSRWSSVMCDLAALDSGAEALATIFRYLSLVVEDLSPQIVHSALSLAAPETKDSLMTTLAERWKAEGLAEGLVRGQAVGARQLLRRQLELKFGPVSSETAARLDGASDAEIDQWAGRVLTADTVADVMGD